MIGMIPTIWSIIKTPIKALHDWISPISPDEEYGLIRKARQDLYDTMYDHLKIDQGVRLLPSHKPDVMRVTSSFIDDLRSEGN